jgi:hypothetical protein
MGEIKPQKPGSRLRHSNAVKAELNLWHLNDGEKAMVLAFCACVGLRMQGDDMTNYLKPPNIAHAPATKKL